MLALAGCGGDDKSSTDANDARTDATAPQEKQASGPGGCEQLPVPQPREPGKQEKPKPLAEGTDYSLTFKTSCGEFTVELDVEQSPKAAASLVSLARADYFDGVAFHRIVPGSIIQGGDPTLSGGGGPGYTTVDTPSPNTTYTPGVMAMAKTAEEPRGAAGSQFFVVTGEGAGYEADYAIVGNVSEGFEVVQQIGQFGDPATEQPTMVVVIEDVEVSEG
jgi:cyclophilin family peptidyl-prolyl cis-trans isomerase